MGLKRRYAMSCYWSISATHRHSLVGPGGDCRQCIQQPHHVRRAGQNTPCVPGDPELCVLLCAHTQPNRHGTFASMFVSQYSDVLFFLQGNSFTLRGQEGLEGQDPDCLEADEAVVDEIARMPDATIDVAAAKEDLSNTRLSMSKVHVCG